MKELVTDVDLTTTVLVGFSSNRMHMMSGTSSIDNLNASTFKPTRT